MWAHPLGVHFAVSVWSLKDPPHALPSSPGTPEPIYIHLGLALERLFGGVLVCSH